MRALFEAKMMLKGKRGLTKQETEAAISTKLRDEFEEMATEVEKVRNFAKEQEEAQWRVEEQASLE